jgi:hypothetical protein
VSGLARHGIWNDLAVRDALSWYLAVAENWRPAKFRIVATVVAQLISGQPHASAGCERDVAAGSKAPHLQASTECPLRVDFVAEVG